MNGQTPRTESSGDDGHALRARSHTPPPVGTVEWERAGGPPLSFGQKLSLLGGAGAVILTDLGPRLWWLLSRWGFLSSRRPEKVDLAAWAPPDTRAAREAEQYLREVSSGPMVHHSLRTYYFSGILYELSGVKQSIDREALYVAALLHDVGLFQTSPPATEHCFSVGGAREARRIAKDAGWDEALQDRMAVAITTNLNAFVPLDKFGPEAHFMSVGGLVEVIAQEWKLHPENLAEILRRYPRDGFADEALRLVQREVKQNPGGRFACLNPLFPMMVRRTAFSQEAPRGDQRGRRERKK
jgi:HD domain